MTIRVLGRPWGPMSWPLAPCSLCHGPLESLVAPLHSPPLSLPPANSSLSFFGAAVYFAVDFWVVDAGLRWISKMLRSICAEFAVF